MNEPTIIISKLDDKALQESIDKLISDVDKKLNGESGLAGKFKQGMEAMQNSLNTFATTMKTVKSDVGDMSKSFEAMFKAMSGAGGSGANSGGKGGSTTGGSTTASAPNTIGELREQIKLQGQIVDQQVRSTAEKERQVNKQRQLTNELEKELRSTAQSRLQRGLNMQPQGLDEAQRKLQYLQAVQRRYASTTQLSAQEQRNLANAIARTQREIAKINNTRPKTLKEVLGMDESSVDAITRKMRELKRVQISDPAQVNNLSSAYQRLTDKRREMLGQNQLLENSNLSLARSFNYIRNRLVYAFTIGAVMNFTRELVRVRAEYEMLDRSLGILIGDMEKGTQIFNELNEMALKSPFTLIELGTAAKQLTAYNFAANEVVDTTRRLADISAALGVPMERLTYNLGQIKAQGVLNARDARDFANAGLAIVPMLAQLYTKQKRFGDEIVTTAQVYDMMSKKMVSYGDVLHVLTDITDEGGKFFDFQARQADTLKVQLANLTLAYNNMLNEIGTDNQGIISGALGMLRSLAQNWKTVKNAILAVVTALGAYKGAMAIAYLWSKRMAISGAIETFIGLAKEVKTAKNAMLLFNMVCKANPLGILVSLLATAGVAFLTFGEDVEEASESVNMFGENASKQINKVDSLTKVLKAVNQGTNTYKNALGELNQIAQEYGIEEIKTLDELIVKREHLIELIQREGAERTYANNIAKSQEKYDKGVESTINELRSALQKNYGEAEADAYSAIIEDVLTRNIDLIVGKSGKELDKGFREIQEKIKQGLRNAGLSDLEINVLFHTSQSDINKAQNGILKLRNEQTIYNATIENYHKNATKATKATMTWQERLNANQKALRDVSKDAMALYNRMYEMVELAQKNKNNDIRFNLKLVADEPPAWMSKMPIEKLRELAVRFGALAQSGTRVKGHQDDADYAYMRYVQYTSAYRTAQEKAAQDNNKTTKTRTKQTDEFAKAIKKVGDAMTNTRKRQQELLKEGFDGTTILNNISENFGKTIELNNKKLQSFGVTGLKTATDFANMGQREQKSYIVSLLDVAKLRNSAEAIEYLEGKLGDLNDEILKTDNKTLIDSLNSELSRLKEEYEIGLELDANPELGGIIAQSFGLTDEQLQSIPRTAKEVAKRVQKVFDEKLGKDTFNFLDFTDKKAFEGAMGLLGIDPTSNKAKALDAYRQLYNKILKDETKAQTDEWNKLIEKYGGLQAKITKIYKDSVKEQIDIVREFGDNEQVKDALDLSRQINLSQDPAEIARLQQQLANILNDVTSGKPIALKAYQATQKERGSKISKSYWEDFKESDLYAMTFENTANLSNRAIDTMIDKLEELKDKVKESPKDMEALIKAKNELEKTKNERNPFEAIVDGIEEWVNATKKVEQARDRLVLANQNVAIAETQLAQAEKNGLSDEILRKQEQLNKEKKAQEQATTDVTQAENEQKKASTKVRQGMENLANSMNKIKGVFDGVSQIFRMFGDDETADAIDEISKGFSIMASMIMAVVAAMIILESTTPWLLAIAAALGVIVGLVSFLSGQENKRIDKKIKESEQEVKKLELAYKLLNNEAEDAYGTMVMGARQAVKANKELQLAELKRQLALEQSRDSKHRDEDRIIELRGQIIDLEREVNKATEETLNAILGISSHGDFFEDLISSMIDAFKQGEDAMEVFEEKWDEMIDNMIMKTIVQRFLSTWVDSLEQGAEDIINKYTKDTSKEKADLAKKISDQQQMDAGDLGEWLYAHNKEYYIKLAEQVSDGQLDYDRLAFADSSWRAERLIWFNKAWRSGLAQKIADAYYADADNQLKVLDQKIADETLSATKDLINYYGGAKEDFKTNYMPSIMEAIKENFTFGQDNEKELSALQRGIQGITEDTAGALEAYMNGVSQQVYLQSDLLTQIRDAVVGIDSDVQTATQAQMLLQLQQSYQVQMSIESILQGVLVPSGRAFAVEIQ